MNPGKACIQCHLAQEGKPEIAVGGTVYPTAHEPDLCFGVNGGAQVIITDTSNQEFVLNVGPTGNFSLSDKVALAMPIRAKVVQNGKAREMISPQNTGDCNGCHTENGANGAPGRIMLP